MLYFIGMGLYDEKDISVRGLETVRSCSHVFLETYTSRLMGTSIDNLAKFLGKEIHALNREDVESKPKKMLDLAKESDVAFLVCGDPMVSTTHADLRIRAQEMDIPTSLIHASSISSAVCGISGLQNYRFGKSCSIPFPEKGWLPTAPLDTINANSNMDLHTLVYLDIKEGRYMIINEAIEIIEMMAKKNDSIMPELYIGIARAGSSSPTVIAGDMKKMKSTDFGNPLHILIVPASLHHIEREYLERFAGLCQSVR